MIQGTITISFTNLIVEVVYEVMNLDRHLSLGVSSIVLVCKWHMNEFCS